MAPLDAEIVRRFQAAGLVLFAQTNTPELGIMGVTEPRLRGPSRNPWSTDHSPGGSSGGSAAAVAARIVPAAHGNDGGGLAPHPRLGLRDLRAEAEPRPGHASARRSAR